MQLTQQSKTSILVADDEPGLGLGISEALEREGYQVTTAQDGESALKLAEQGGFHLIIADVRMPGCTGVELLERVKATNPEAIVILMTAYGTVTAAVEAMKLGAYDYLPKPLDLRRLRAVVKQALEFQSLMVENKELRQRLQKKTASSLLIGTSEPMLAVTRLIDEVASSDVTVLIHGESGTGKELVARAIHSKSPRHSKPFISVNCAALPEQLLESELFGHVKGAFTGAYTTRPGRFQMAEGGTLFLDEVADMPAKGQGDLLRVLEEGAFRMVGSSDSTQTNVRIITASNKDLSEYVQEGKFREDLFYRLHVVPIELPPLRERAEDIPLLLVHFLQQFAAKHHRSHPSLSSEAAQICQRYRWPGNVRELRNIAERLIITVHHKVIEAEDLPEPIGQSVNAQNEFRIRAGMSLEEVEKELIRQTLVHVSSNREEAAASLGISRRTLQYKLKRYGLLPGGEPNAASQDTKDEAPDPDGTNRSTLI
jgi:DNA-binding NtrC family response regulator